MQLVFSLVMKWGVACERIPLTTACPEGATSVGWPEGAHSCERLCDTAGVFPVNQKHDSKPEVAYRIQLLLGPAACVGITKLH